MGQQQVILLVLVSVIVGIATIIAINTMSESRESANHSAVRQRLLEAAAEAQMYYVKESMLGGGSKSFQSITLSDINLDTSMVDGDFEITQKSQESFQITVQPAAGGGPIIGVVSKNNISITP
ncbi:MAG: hypothetical protein FH748_01920 [Balneolaceae bacterium]|nr:hypothetical protein [Balneolaceae bacterium]